MVGEVHLALPLSGFSIGVSYQTKCGIIYESGRYSDVFRIAENMELTADIQTAIESEAPMTMFQLQEDKEQAQHYNDLPRDLDINPWLTQTPTELLQREYRMEVGTLVVPSTAPSIHSVFASDIFTNTKTVFPHVLRTFKFFRFKKIHWRVVITTSPFVFGFIGFTMLPNDGRRSNNPGDDFGWLSHDDCILVDVCTMSEVELGLDWPFNNNWLDLRNQNEAIRQNFDKLTSLKFVRLLPSLNRLPSGPTGIDYQVFLRFDGCEVAGFMPDEIVGQSLSGAVAGTLTDMALNHGSKMASGAVSSGMDYAANEAAKAFQQGYEYFFSSESESSSQPVKSVNGTQTGESVSSVVPDMYGGLVMSPPRNVLGDGTMVLPTPQRRHSFASFLRKPSLVWYSVLAAPADSFSWDTNPNVDLNELSNVNHLAGCSRIRFLSTFYRWWRGSVNYTAIVFGSPLVTYRIVLTVSYGGTVPVQAELGNHYTKVITIRGTNKVNITVPFLYDTPWLPTMALFAPGYESSTSAIMKFEYESVTGTGTVVPGPLILLYESAGNDFMFSSRVEPSPLVTPTEITAQMRVRSFRSIESDAGASKNIPRAVDGVSSFEEMVQRWSMRRTASLNSAPKFYTGSVGSNMSVGTYDALGSIFVYYRGQTKLKIAPTAAPENSATSNIVWTVKMDTTKPDTATGSLPNQRVNDGMASINLSATQVMEFTVPYLANKDWMFSSENDEFSVGMLDVFFEPTLFMANTAGDPDFNVDMGVCMISGGPDFAYAFELPPPVSYLRWYDYNSGGMQKSDSKWSQLHGEPGRMPCAQAKQASIPRRNVTRNTILRVKSRDVTSDDDKKPRKKQSFNHVVT